MRSCCLVPTSGRREDYPLVSANVNISLLDVQLQVEVTQTYVSLASYSCDVTFVFPLPSDAAVHAFKAVIDNTRTINGVAKTKVDAKRDFDEAVANGKTAALLEQHNVESTCTPDRQRVVLSV